MAFADSLKFLRRKKKLTQKALAEAAGLSYNSIVNYENGRRNDPPASVVEKLAKALEVPPDLLYSSQFIEIDGTIIAEKRNSWGRLEYSSIIQDREKTEEQHDEVISEYAYMIEKQEALTKIGALLDYLNQTGIAEAVKRVSELTEISKYAAEFVDTEEVTPCPEDAPQTAADYSPGSGLTDAGNAAPL